MAEASMRVLIIGCGYVGVELGGALVRRGHHVYGMRRGDGTAAKLRANITPIQADITEPRTLETLPRNWDWVVNCVSSGGGGVEEYRNVYVKGTQNVLKWLADSPPKKFVYTSSTSVYGQDKGELVTEDSPAEPTTETGDILLEAERLMLNAATRGAFPAVILRLSGIYGPARGYWFKQFVKGEADAERDDGRILNMVHRDDATGAILSALERGKSGTIYNVSDDEPVTLFEFYKWLGEQLGSPPKQTVSPYRNEKPGTLPAKRGSRRGSTNKQISNARLKSELGYRFKYPTFREGYAGELDVARKSTVE